MKYILINYDGEEIDISETSNGTITLFYAACGNTNTVFTALGKSFIIDSIHCNIDEKKTYFLYKEVEK